MCNRSNSLMDDQSICFYKTRNLILPIVSGKCTSVPPQVACWS